MSTRAIRPISLPGWLGARTIPPTLVFASLFLLTTLCRSLVIAVIPIQALELLGTAQAVSVMFLLVSIAGVTTGLLTPTLVLRFRTRRVFHLAAASAFFGALFLGIPSLPFFLLGIVGWTISTVAFEVTMSLYIMHLVIRRELGFFEPKRVFFMITAYTIGPWLGVYLESRVTHWAPFVLTMVMAVASVAYFRYLGLREAGARQRVKQAPNPLRHLRRFASQPRLRLAWTISFSRASWWHTFMIYTPIYAVTIGLGDTVGGALVSLGVATVYSIGLWGRFARRYGLRRLLILGFALSGLTSMVVTLVAGLPWLCAAVLLVSALVTASLDAGGNVPFLRAVRPLEREEMTGVFSTYRDASQLLPPALFAIVLSAFPVQVVFTVMGIWMLVMVGMARYLHKRL